MFSDFIIDFLCEISDFHASLVALALFSYRNSAFIDLIFTHNEQIRNMLHFIVANLSSDFFRAVINCCSNIAVIQLTANFVGIVIIFV